MTKNVTANIFLGFAFEKYRRIHCMSLVIFLVILGK